MSNPPATTQIVSVSLAIAGEQRARLSAVNVGTRDWASLIPPISSRASNSPSVASTAAPPSPW